MLIKISPRKEARFGRLLNYIFRDKAALTNNEEGGFVYCHNISGHNIQDYEQCFLDNERFRQVNRKDSVRMRHIILSFNAADSPNIDRTTLLDLTRKFVRSYDPMGLYIAVPHYDREHIHIHIAASGIRYRTGESIWKTNAEFQEVKRSLEIYQERKYPALSHSIVGYRQRYRKFDYMRDGEYRTKQRGGISKKEQVKSLAKNILEKARDIKDFQFLLSKKNIQTYSRGGQVYGVIADRKKYRFTTLGLKKELKQLMERSKENERGKSK